MYSHHEMTESNSFLVEVIFVMMFFYFILKPIVCVYVCACVCVHTHTHTVGQ